MKNFHPLSFGLGLGSGLLLLMIVVGSMRLMTGSGRTGPGGNWQQFQGAGGAPVMMNGRMAERLGMTQEQLQQELDSGKTIQEIFTERGMEMPVRAGGNMMVRGGEPNTASGSDTSSAPTVPDTASSSS